MSKLASAIPPRWRRWLIPAFLALGVLLISIYGLRSWRAFQSLQFAQEQGLLDGSASVDAIRPWMTLRYVAVAYAVPEEYLYDALEIPFERRQRDVPLMEINRTFFAGERSGAENEPAVILALQTAVLDYRENPVATGLRDVRDWMSLAYIANSSGVPVAYLVEALELPADVNTFKPLNVLSRDYRLAPPRELARQVADLLATYEAPEEPSE